MEGKGVNWWGTDGEHCDLAFCPTAKGIVRGEARILVQGGKIKKIIIENLKLLIDINNKIRNKNNCRAKSIKI